jgi:hypothetical protein
VTDVGRAASPVGRPSRLSRNRALRIGELGADHLLASRNGRPGLVRWANKCRTLNNLPDEALLSHK